MVHTSSAVVLGALALNAASALATPINPAENTENKARDFEEDVEARGLGSFIGKAAPFLPLLGMLPGLGGQHRRELEAELETRGLTDTLKKVSPWAPLIPVAMDFLKPKPQQQQPTPPPPPPPERREIEEFLGRELSDNEARGLGSFLGKAAPFLPFIGMLPGLNGAQQRRDVADGEVIEERGLGKIAGKIAPWAPLIPIGLGLLGGGQQQQAPPPPPPQRREIEEILGRELTDVEARDLGGLLDTVSQVAPWLPMISGMLPEKKPTVPPKPTNLRAPPKGKRSDDGEDGELDTRGLRTTFDKVAPWGTVIGVGADLLRQKLSPPPPPPQPEAGLPPVTGTPPVARDVEDGEELEARGRIGNFVNKAAPWAPLVAVGADMINSATQQPQQPQQPSRRDLEELLGRELTDVEARGFRTTMGKVAPWAPLIATGLSLLPTGQQQRREVEDIMDDIEARGFRTTMGKVAPWAPLIATGLSLLPTGQQQRREVDEIMDELEARGFRTTMGKVAPWAPLIATGLSLLPSGQQRRDVAEEIMDIFHRELSSSLEDLD